MLAGIYLIGEEDFSFYNKCYMSISYKKIKKILIPKGKSKQKKRNTYLQIKFFWVFIINFMF